jgi:hypothetical protein
MTSFQAHRICAFVCLVWSLAPAAQAQDALVQPAKDEVMVGPVSVTQPVQGVVLNFRGTAFLSLKTEGNSVVLRARTVADLSDLQSKIAALIDTVPLPTNNCDHFGVDNVVARIWGKRLDITGSTATLRLNGDVDSWACVKNPLPCSKVVWVNDGPFGLSRPKIETWECNPPIKNRNINQPFDAAVPFTLEVRDPQTVGISLGAPTVTLGGALGGDRSRGASNCRDRYQHTRQRCDDPGHLQRHVAAQPTAGDSASQSYDSEGDSQRQQRISCCFN